MSSVYKMDHLSVPTSVLFYMIQNTVNVTCITNFRYNKWKDVKKNFIFTSNSCIDNEAAIGLCNVA